MWITDDAIANWQAAPRLTPGGQPCYSDLAIETGMMVRMVFHLPLRQTEGLMSSVFELLGVSIAVPDHSTLSRRAMNLKSISRGCTLPAGPVHLLIDSTGLKVYGAGEWSREKHGARARRSWRKLHLATDAITGMIVAATLTENDRGDSSQVKPLLTMVEEEIASVTADGAYDGAPTYEAVAAIAGDIEVIIPPRVSAVLTPAVETIPSERERHIVLREVIGRLRWQKFTGYNRRSRVETTMGRYKGIIGPTLRARSPAGQDTESAIGVAVLNRMLYAGRPDSIRYP